MYRYLVFGFDAYYPGGGMQDCKLKTNDFLYALAYAKKFLRDARSSELSEQYATGVYDYFHIYDFTDDITTKVSYDVLNEFTMKEVKYDGEKEE